MVAIVASTSRATNSFATWRSKTAPRSVIGSVDMWHTSSWGRTIDQGACTQEGSFVRDLNTGKDSRLQAGGEGPLVLVADGTVRRQRPLDEIVALVIVDAAARVEEGRVPIAVHRQQPGSGQLLGHLDGVPVGSGRIIGVAHHQHRIRGLPGPGAEE